ncbi:MAG: asparagine synthase (glutamine-hydrolyzing), partial [Candidatus Aenigmarchaeota archaeon]
KSMMASLSHRGPDDSGTFTDRNVSLGHNRLSIIDLSEKARQPMESEDGSMVMVCNGEIYNFRELRKELEKESHRFSSDSDSEVIVHAYEEWGPKFLDRLRGVFALAVYDRKRGLLVVARDRLGVKPLYYHFDDSKFIFASEIKAILEYRKFPLDKESLDDFFTFQYVLAPKTLFGGVRKLRPAEALVLDLKTRKLSSSIYWRPNTSLMEVSERHFAKELEKLIKESVDMRMVSDVPLGIYLSGGLDSSYITALASENRKDLRTFTVGFGHHTDETKYARMVADEFGTDHKEVIVEDMKMDVLPTVTWHLDVPVVDIAAIPLYIMAKESKKHLTVALAGDGGDEIFGGYDKYKAMAARRYYTKVPGALRKPANLLAKRRMGKEKYRRFKELMGKDWLSSYLAYISTFSEEEKRRLYATEFVRAANLDERAKLATLVKGRGSMENIIYLDFKTQLPEDYLMKVDKMTMANAIEARVPLLDQKVVELSMRIPASMKVSRMKTKYMFRKMAAKKLPREIVQRKKSGFTLPTEKWMKEGMREVALQMFESAPKEIIDRKEARKIIEKYERSKRYYTRQLWSIFSFVLWHKMYFGKEKLSLNMEKHLS